MGFLKPDQTYPFSEIFELKEISEKEITQQFDRAGWIDRMGAQQG